MTDAPEKIWAYAGSFKMWRDHKTYQPPTQIEYTRSDIADTLQKEVARLAAALEAIIWEYDPSDPGGISEIMFDIAFDAQTHGEADQ